MSYERHKDKKTIWLFFFWTYIESFGIQIQDNLFNIKDTEWDGIRVKEFEAAQIHFLSDAFVSVAVIKAKTPLYQLKWEPHLWHFLKSNLTLTLVM